MPLAKLFAAVIGSLAGGWMIFDGVHVMVRGKYFGPDKPGPWSVLVSRVGVDPFSLGPAFVLLGAAWLVFLIALLAGQAWGWYGSVVVAVATLSYAPLGTVLALGYLGLLFFAGLRGGTA